MFWLHTPLILQCRVGYKKKFYLDLAYIFAYSCHLQKFRRYLLYPTLYALQVLDLSKALARLLVLRCNQMIQLIRARPRSIGGVSSQAAMNHLFDPKH